jgi:NAD(P)-dependent dehydrogenase (short-subunit alcohol dehydrogenase family)
MPPLAGGSMQEVDMSAPSTTNSRVSLVTGGTEGIGRAVCIELARRGDRVLFVGRNERLAEATLRILQEAGPERDHTFIRADLARLSEASRAADQVLEHTSRLDAAVFCAGVLSTLPEWTEENLERNFALNYLSRFVLARRLLPALLAAPSGRVVLVANAGKYPDTLRFDDLQHRKGKAGLHVAGRTQFANDLFALELAERTRGSNLEVTCVFPGMVKTRVFANARGLPWFVRALAPVLRLFALSPSEAANTPAFLAYDEQARGTSGRFYGPRKKELPVPPRARRADRRDQLWLASENIVQELGLGTLPAIAARQEHAPNVMPQAWPKTSISVAGAGR